MPKITPDAKADEYVAPVEATHIASYNQETGAFE